MYSREATDNPHRHWKSLSSIINDVSIYTILLVSVLLEYRSPLLTDETKLELRNLPSTEFQNIVCDYYLEETASAVRNSNRETILTGSDLELVLDVLDFGILGAASEEDVRSLRVEVLVQWLEHGPFRLRRVT